MDINSLPLYNVSLDDVDMLAISLVEQPAVKSPLYAFSKPRELFSITSSEKQIVLAPVIRVDYPILRQNPDGSYYNLVFSEEVAQKMISNYLYNGYSSNFNLEHSSFFPECIKPLSFFTKRSDIGINPVPELYSDVADGSVFAELKIESDDIWNNVKAGTWTGLSLEAYLSKEPAQDFSSMSVDDLLVAILTH